MKRIAIGAALLLAAAALFAQQATSTVLLRTSGTLVSGDTVSPEGDYQDTYSVKAPDVGRLEIVVASIDFAPKVMATTPGSQARNAGGDSNAAKLIVPVAAGAQVSIAVAGVPSSRVGGARQYADYMIAVTFAQGGGDLAVGSTISGELSINDETDENGSYVDWYDVPLKPGERVRVTLTSDAFDAYLRVDLPDGQTLENDDVDDTNSALSFSSATGGMARVGATSFDYQSTGPYTLSMTAAQDQTLSVGQTLSDVLQGENMIYVLTGNPGDAVTIELRSPDFDTYLELTDSSGTDLTNDDADGTALSRLTYQIGSDGEAQVIVSSYDGGTGNFTLTATAYTYDGPVIADGYQLADGETVEGALNPSLPSTDGLLRQRFTFQGTSGQRVELLLSSEEIDSYLTVDAPSGDEFTDDDSGGGYDSRLTLTLGETGTYDVYVADLNGGTAGAYSLAFKTLPPAKIIYEATGDLSETDQTDITGKYYDVHTFGVQKGHTITVDVLSDDFDAFAIVRAPSGQILYRDDDGAGGSNPRVQFTADRTEDLQLIVTSYDMESTGHYAVSIYE